MFVCSSLVKINISDRVYTPLVCLLYKCILSIRSSFTQHKFSSCKKCILSKILHITPFLIIFDTSC